MEAGGLKGPWADGLVRRWVSGLSSEVQKFRGSEASGLVGWYASPYGSGTEVL